MNRGAFNPPTLAAAAILIAGAGVLYGSALATGFHLLKTPTPIRRHLFLFPERIGPYSRVERRTLSKEMTDELGTGEHIIWTWRRDGAADRSPGHAITMLVAYYAGSPDAAPHVSPRCYVAGGIEPTSAVDRVVSVKRADGGAPLDVPMRLFAPPSEPGEAPTRSVIAFTHIVGGRAIADPAAVSEAVFDPATPHGWWCRVELMIPYAGDADAAAEVAAEFLAHALPPIMEHLPAAEVAAAGNEGTTRR